MGLSRNRSVGQSIITVLFCVLVCVRVFAQTNDPLATVNARLGGGVTKLITAAIVGHADEVRALIEAGADVNAKMDNGYTALMYAATVGATDEVRALVAAKASELDTSGLAVSGRTQNVSSTACK
jgi:ankyrin repeat protein